jgi:hypothetical protein
LPNFSSSLAFIPAADVAVKDGKVTLCATALSTIMVMRNTGRLGDLKIFST